MMKAVLKVDLYDDRIKQKAILIVEKAVLKVDLYDDRMKLFCFFRQHDRMKLKAMKAVSGISGAESVSVDMNDKKMTVIGDIDPVHVIRKLRKLCHTELVSVGPGKDLKKKEESENSDDIEIVSIGPAEEENIREESENSDNQTRPPLQCNQCQSHCVTGVDEGPNCIICELLKSQRFE